MSDVIISNVETAEDPREKTAREVCGMIRSAAEIAETAIRSEDPDVEKSLRDSAKVLLAAAGKRLDESIGTAVADEEDDE